jgi:lipopolysaccharide biosynthesis regulator YciM
MFNSNSPYNVRVSVLEEKLQVYEDISKKMLSKLEQAVEKISESNANISQILIRHEERIDRASEAENTLLRLIEKTEEDLSDRIDTNTSEIDGLKKNRWLLAGIVIGITFILSQFRVFDYILPQPPPDHHHATPGRQV